jgi:hypothetical protein
MWPALLPREKALLLKVVGHGRPTAAIRQLPNVNVPGVALLGI